MKVTLADMMPKAVKETILVSACLLGQRVRYDGGQAQLTDSDLLTQLAAKFNIVPICPELFGGLSTPRAPAEIKLRNGRIEVINCHEQVMTAAFVKGAEQACASAEEYRVTRALLKSKSPSCGRGLIYDGSFTSNLRKGDGITVQYLQAMGVQVFNENDVALLLMD